MKNTIRTINISTEYVFEMHNVNANEDASPKNVKGRFYISGQKVRFMLMSGLNLFNRDSKDTFVSTSDGVTCNISDDLRSDLNGYMETGDKIYGNKRNSPVYTSFALSKKKSTFFEDLWVRFKTSNSEDKHNAQRINNKTYSELDVVNFNYMLDCSMLSTTKYYEFDPSKKTFISEHYIKHVDETERKRRVRLFIEATSQLIGLANQARNAVVNTPEKVFIAFDEVGSFVKFFEMDQNRQSDYLSDLNTRKIKYFIGDNKKVESGFSVREAYVKP